MGPDNNMGTITHLPVSVNKLATVLFLIFGSVLVEDLFVFAETPTTTITYTTGAGDLGTRTITQDHTILIVGGTRSDQGSGTNLFHSFKQFNVGGGDTAKFLNTTPSLHTDAILSRVTGGSLSSIYGTIDTSSYPGTNFFLMNPAGIVFGPSAILNVSGSVAFTTADYLRLANANGSNAGIFHANTTATNLLTSASVAAFGFLGENPVAIEAQGTTLAMQPGQSISLVGGNITVQSGMLIDKADPSAPGNQVYIGSIASPGELLAGTLAPAENIIRQFPGTLGTVHISHESKIDTSNQNGGTIRIRGGHLVVDNSKIFAGSGGISFDTTSISLKNSALIGTYTTATANAGDITLRAARDIKMDSHARVESQTFVASRDAGNITFRTSQGNVTLSNDATITSQAFTGGRNAGSIEIEAQNGDIRLETSSLIFPSTDREAKGIGGVRITANNLELSQASRIDSDNKTTQVASPIDILVRGRLRLTGGSEIESTTTLGKARAADMIIKASEIQILEGSKLSANAEAASTGAGGGISIQGLVGSSDSVTVDGPGSGIFTGTKGIGPGGAIDLVTRSLSLQNGGTISAETTGTSASAIGGSINITATDQVTLTDGASITARSTGPADAGTISINAGQQLDLMGKSSITTEAKQASGGNINLQATDRIRLVDSTLSASVSDGPGGGGNISIDPKLVLFQNSTVLAQADQGTGGRIAIRADSFVSDANTVVNADAGRGVNGTVTIQSPTSNLSGTVGQLVSKTSPPQVLLQNRCVALAGGEQSTFLLAGRDTLPTEPGGWLNSPISMEHWTGKDTEHASGLMARKTESKRLPSIATHKNDPTILSLRRLTPPGFLVRAFATGSTGCPS
ncbi:MAG: filamentous hemagglutinin N-terminal domain-containing protein [Nitrospira sp.]|nr:MAG: filamentous hemagglutinin N-terminal domain-containing protein [Nitrospira sp.]